MSSVREAMIVAGGMGTRLWPLTADTPKPLLEFCAAPFLEGVIRRIAAVGVERVILVVGADTTPFTHLQQPARQAGVELRFCPEPQPLDTAGGVRTALGEVSGTFLVLNGDILTDVDLDAAIAAHRAARADATLVLTRVEDTSSYGVCVRDGGRITSFLEKPDPQDAGGHDTVNAGTYVLEPDVLSRFPSGPLSFERQVFPELVRSGANVEGFVSDAAWADLGTPSRFLAGHRLALESRLRWPALDDLTRRDDGVWIGEDVHVDDQACVRAPSLLADGVRIGPGALIDARSVVGAESSIAGGARIRGAVLGSSVDVGADAQIDGAIIGAGATIGARARIGSEAVVGGGVHVAAGSHLPPGTTFPARG